jgi:hypothetical protein
VAMTADGVGTAAVETGMAPPVQGMQQTSQRPEKQFLDCQLAAPEKKKEKKPAGLKQDPLGGGKTAWALARWSAVASRTARHGVPFRARLEAADGDDLVL